MKQATKMTVDEFLAEYSKLPDAHRYELQDGEVVVSPEPSPYYGRLQSLAMYILNLFAGTAEGVDVIAPTNVEFTSDTCRGPDALVLLPNSKVREEPSRLVGSPALIVEVVSPSQPHLDLFKKRDLYMRQKVAEIWFLDSREREALFLTRAGSKYREQSLKQGIYHSTVLKGLKFDVGALFALDRKALRKSTGM